MDLSKPEHLPTQTRILKEGLCLELEFQEEADLVDPSSSFDLAEEDRMKKRDLLLSRRHPGAKGKMPQGIHDLCDIDIVWTPDATGVAGRTDPDRLRSENFFPVTVLDVAKDLIGKEVHRLGYRTPRRALLALVAGLEVFAAFGQNLG